MSLTIAYSGLLAKPVNLVARIHDLEHELLKGAQVECPVRNLFSPGIYMREMTIPAGTVLTGAEHKTRHMNILSAGRIMVWTEGGMKELAAPCTFESLPGTKRAGWALEDTVWTTVHANPDDEIDLEILVERLTTAKYSDLLENRAQIAHQGEQLCHLE